jgi:glucosamine--fructose-6-phosphate aminotransferase (isomerizing)
MLPKGFMEGEVEDTPRAIGRLLSRIAEHIAEVSEVVKARRIERFFLVGCGSSFNSAYIASYGFNGGTFNVYYETSSSFALYRGGLSSRDCVIGFSRSGETTETIWALERARSNGCTTIAITNDEGSSMARIADVTIPIYAGEERSVVMTKTFVNLALAGLYLGADISGNDRLIDEFKGLDRIASDILEVSKKVEDRSIPMLSGENSIYCIGEGVCYGSARESAIKLIETSRILASYFHAMEFRHGPIAIADERPVIAIVLRDPAWIHIEKLVSDIASITSKLILITNSEDYQSDDTILYKIDSDRNAELLAALAVIPVQRIAYRIALSRGFDPDRPRHLSRYVKLA